MLKIAVCDDEPSCLEAVAERLRRYLQARPDLSGQVALFRSGQDLLDEVEARGGFEIYLLDILMPGLDGIQTGLKLRELGADGEIIYLTGANDYAAESYLAQAFFYLLKPVEEGALFSVLDRAAAQWSRRRTEAVVVETPGGPRRILLEHILYVERVGRAAHYNCADGVVASRALRCAFREAVAPLLKDRRFYLCGSSFVLNFAHVSAVEPDGAVLDDGRCVPIPRRLGTQVRRLWMDYWLSETPI